ncbi:unnamed protein product [Dibothriocephalus latus]|uniref:Uncharacterized protein n=1 Tax=Dibothriocephalus latus TaxID=60516 RepID=A0A3P7QXT1_DIBLA|nr:unnamed protein product [Dibothriocephalus latus]
MAKQEETPQEKKVIQGGQAGKNLGDDSAATATGQMFKPQTIDMYDMSRHATTIRLYTTKIIHFPQCTLKMRDVLDMDPEKDKVFILDNMLMEPSIRLFFNVREWIDDFYWDSMKLALSYYPMSRVQRFKYRLSLLRCTVSRQMPANITTRTVTGEDSKGPIMILHDRKGNFNYINYGPKDDHSKDAMAGTTLIEQSVVYGGRKW